MNVVRPFEGWFARRMGRRGVQLLAAVAVLCAVLAGCYDNDVIGSNPHGTNAQSGDILLRGVRIAPPPDPSYQAGADPVVWLTIVNAGRQDDTLVRVSSPQAAEVEILWDGDCDGTSEVVPSLRLPAGAPPDTSVQQAPSAPAGQPLDVYSLRLVDLRGEVLAGTAVPVTFTFANAHPVTVDVPVRPHEGASDRGVGCPPAGQ